MAFELEQFEDGDALCGGEDAGGVAREEAVFAGGGAVEEDVDVAVACDMFATLTIHCFVSWLRGGEAVDVSVEHAECRGDQHGVVDLDIGRSCFTGVCDIFRRNVLAALLYMSRDDEESL